MSGTFGSVVDRALIGLAVLAFVPLSAGAGTFDLGLDEVVPELRIAAAVEAEPVEPGVNLLPAASSPVDGFLHQVGKGVVALAVAPLAWERADWRRLGLGLAAVGAVGVFDDEVNRFSDAHRSRGLVRAADAVRPLGREGGLVLLGALYLAGRRLERPRLAAVTGDGLEAVLLSSGLLVPILKEATGRIRPRHTADPGRFGAGGGSFPSGETSEAFAIAAVVSAHSERRWVRGLAWSLAGLTAVERIALDGHWASDVVAGALIGASVGRWVVRHNRPEVEDRRRLTVMPTVEPERWGVVATVRF